jgi:DNA-binding winged helix-turn-helix (wHTH) protein/Tol biopolymer transport system component
MGDAGRSPQVTRFGIFEVDLRSGELHKHGLKVKLQEQPFEILTMLLAHPGEVVTREELRKELWPEDTFVDFDNSLNTGINKVREALGDSADNPRFIETLPRRGYRFIAPVDGETLTRASGIEVLPEERSRRQLAGRILRSRYTKVAAAVVFLAVAAFILLLLARPLPPPRVLRVVQLTAGGEPLSISGLISDGQRIYYTRYQRQVGRLSLVSMPVSGGEVAAVPTFLQNPYVEHVSPDGTQLLVTDRIEWPVNPLYVLPAGGGQARRVGDIKVVCAGWFPDGRRFVYASFNGIYLTNPDGSGVRKIVTTARPSYWPRVSPDGKVIRFSQAGLNTTDSIWVGLTTIDSIWEVAVDGTGLRPLLPEWKDSRGHCCGDWSADGRYYVFQTEDGPTNTWAIREKVGLLRWADSEPVQLTAGPMPTRAPLVSKDSRRIFVIGRQERAEVTRYDVTAHKFEPFLPGESVAELGSTSDGGWLYVSYPERSIWKANQDMSERVRLTMPSMEVRELGGGSPDGKHLLFNGRERGGTWKAYLAPARGGPPQPLALADSGQQFGPMWSPDGNRVLFTQATDDTTQGFKGGDIRLFDMRTRQVEILPDSKGLFGVCWLADGRHMAALRAGTYDLMIFDLQTQRWTELLKGPVGYPHWTHDGKHVYFLGSKDGDNWICRLRLRDRKVERIVSLNEIQRPQWPLYLWLGFAPDDSPLVLRDLSFQEVYALDVELP